MNTLADIDIYLIPNFSQGLLYYGFKDTLVEEHIFGVYNINQPKSVEHWFGYMAGDMLHIDLGSKLTDEVILDFLCKKNYKPAIALLRNSKIDAVL